MRPADLEIVFETRGALQNRVQSRSVEIGNADEMLRLHLLYLVDASAAQPPPVTAAKRR